MPPKAAPWRHRSIASVHSRARSKRARPWAAQTSSQYIIPVVSGSTAPDISSAPDLVEQLEALVDGGPCRIVTRAVATRPITTAGSTPIRVPSSMASAACSPAASMSPHMKRS